MSRLALLLLVALVSLGAPGCASPVRFDAEDSTPLVERPALPVPVRLGIVRYEGRHQVLHDMVRTALSHDLNFTHIRDVAPGERPVDVDYVVDLSYEAEPNARWYNSLIAFPGFLVFAQHWAGLRWDLGITTRGRLLRARTGTEASDFVRRDDHHLAYTSPGYAISIGMGWFGLLFPPAAVSPLVSGIVAATVDGQALKYLRLFHRSHAGWNWARRVAYLIADRIERDLGPAGPQ